MKIMKCTFIVQSNGYYLKLKRSKERESQLAIFYFCLYSLSGVFNDINDNKKIKSVCSPSLDMNKEQKFNCFY